MFILDMYNIQDVHPPCRYSFTCVAAICILFYMLERDVIRRVLHSQSYIVYILCTIYTRMTLMTLRRKYCLFFIVISLIGCWIILGFMLDFEKHGVVPLDDLGCIIWYLVMLPFLMDVLE